MMPVNTGRLLQHPSNTVRTFGQRWVDVAMTSRVLWDARKVENNRLSNSTKFIYQYFFYKSA